ncbi:MAG: hypothetical protein OEX81_02515 [Candidatus Pacebacteria bacterium]|nr:hypothetical protein [Candidatus Paceibacterota bacterium]
MTNYEGQISEEQILEAVRQELMVKLDQEGLAYSKSKESVSEKSHLVFPIEAEKRKAFAEKLGVNWEDFEAAFYNISYGVNEIINDTSTGYALGMGLTTSLPRYQDYYPDARDFIDDLCREVQINGDAYSHQVLMAMVKEHLRPVDDSQTERTLEGYMENLDWRGFDWVKEYIEVGSSNFDLALVIQAAKNVSRKRLMDKASGLVKKHFSGFAWGYENRLGVYSPKSGEVNTYFDEESTSKRKLGLRVRAVAKGVFLGTAVAFSSVIPAVGVIGMSVAEMLKHKYMDHFAKKNKRELRAHELMHQLSASRSDKEGTNSKFGLLTITR